MPVIRTPHIQIVMHLRWPVDLAGDLLTAQAIERLRSFVKERAEAMNVGTYAVGGVPDHLHLLLDLSPDLAPANTENALRAAIERFLRETCGLPAFAWAEHGLLMEGCAPWHVDKMTAYVTEQPQRHATGNLVAAREWDGDDEEDEDAGDDADDEDEAAKMEEWIAGYLNGIPRHPVANDSEDDLRTERQNEQDRRP